MLGALHHRFHVCNGLGSSSITTAPCLRPSNSSTALGFVVPLSPFDSRVGPLENSKAESKNFTSMRLYGESGSQGNGWRKMLNLLSNIVIILAIWVVIVLLVPNKQG
jgi:hypothetical protein